MEPIQGVIMQLQGTKMQMDAQYWIARLKLEPHPEGGYFRQIIKSKHQVAKDIPIYTSIYYLLKSGQYSAFHKLVSDEIWHYYHASPMELTIINQNGVLTNDIIDGQNSFLTVVPGEHWFMARPILENSYSLVGCTMSPGFTMKGFELGSKKELSNLFSQHAPLFNKYCIKE